MPHAVLVNVLFVFFAPTTAEDVLRAAAIRHAFPTNPDAEPVVVATGTRSEPVQGFPATIKYTHITKGPDMFRHEERLTIEGRSFRRDTVFDGKVGWVRVGQGAEELSEDMSAKKVREYQDRKTIRGVTNPDQILADKTLKLERLADAAVGGGAAFVVRVTQNGTERSTVYVDQKSRLVVKVAMPVGGRSVFEQVYSDFKTVAGRTTAMRTEMYADGKLVMWDAVESVEYKRADGYPDSLFRKPAK